MRCKAIGRDDIETDARQQRHAPRPGFGVPRREGLEDVDLPGDVEVGDAVAEAGVGERSRGRRERTGDAERGADALEPCVDAGRVGEIERPGGQAERPGDPFDLFEIAPRQDRARAPVERGPGDQPAGVAGRPVNQDGSAQVTIPGSVDGR